MMENLNTSERFSESFKQQTPIDNKEWAPQAQVQRFANRNDKLLSEDCILLSVDVKTSLFTEK